MAATGMNDLDGIRKELLDAVGAAGNREALEQVRVAALGRKGRITELMKGLGTLAADARKTAGAALNRLKDEIAEAIVAASGRLEAAELGARLARERIDVTLPVAAEREGRIHPISQTIDELTAIFGEMGFAVAEGPPRSPDPHLAGADPHHAARQAADPHHRAGPHLPFRP